MRTSGSFPALIFTQPQAERERPASVILGESELQVADNFRESAKTYANNPVALHLGAMNMRYESLKTNSTVFIVPSSAIETLKPSGLAGLTALTMGHDQDKAPRPTHNQPQITLSLRRRLLTVPRQTPIFECLRDLHAAACKPGAPSVEY
jgi:hypothetical protein